MFDNFPLISLVMLATINATPKAPKAIDSKVANFFEITWSFGFILFKSRNASIRKPQLTNIMAYAEIAKYAYPFQGT